MALQIYFQQYIFFWQNYLTTFCYNGAPHISSGTSKEDCEIETNLMRFSSEEHETSPEVLISKPEMLMKQIQQSSSGIKHFNKVQGKQVHFGAKAELSNIKIVAPNPLQPPPTGGHCVTQYRLVLQTYFILLQSYLPGQFRQITHFCWVIPRN